MISLDEVGVHSHTPSLLHHGGLLHDGGERALGSVGGGSPCNPAEYPIFLVRQAREESLCVIESDRSSS